MGTKQEKQVHSINCLKQARNVLDENRNVKKNNYSDETRTNIKIAEKKSNEILSEFIKFFDEKLSFTMTLSKNHCLLLGTILHLMQMPSIKI